MKRPLNFPRLGFVTSSKRLLKGQCGESAVVGVAENEMGARDLRQ